MKSVGERVREAVETTGPDKVLILEVDEQEQITGCHAEDLTEFMAHGRVPDCDCEQIQCVCAAARPHTKECAFRRALTCAVGIPCDVHGRDVCPVCDACDCGAGKEKTG